MSFWSTAGKIALVGGGVLLAREAYLTIIKRRQLEKSLYLAASQRAHQQDKKILVIGNPEGSIFAHYFGTAFGCGDLCVDPKGCVGCNTHVIGRLEEVLPQLASNRYVIFATDLEFTRGNMANILVQLDRISGGDLFVAHLNPTSLTAWVHPSSQRRIVAAPPAGSVFKYRPLPWHSEMSGVTEAWVELPQTAGQQRGLVPA